MIEYIIIILLAIITLLLYKLNYYKQKYQLYYNNYRQCLKVLGEYDTNLKKYLESREI